MNLIEQFKKFITGNKQREEFNKMIGKEYPGLENEINSVPLRLLLDLSWDLALAQDRIIELEKKINNLMDKANAPAPVITPTEAK